MRVQRSIQDSIQADLASKIVLVSGPRQVGKTYLSMLLNPGFHQYLCFDEENDRRVIRKKEWDRSKQLIIFDELHKWKNWKRWLKGVYDTEGIPPALLVTGSARMDVFKKTGDSLAGRHHSYRLHPLSLGELKPASPGECLDQLIRLGGFPEPYLSGSETVAKRWRASHLDRVLKEEMLDLTTVRDLRAMEILIDLLAERVGSPVSYSSLARVLEVSPHTVKRWISILEGLYVIFVIRPYSKKLSKSLLKEPKIYFFDNGRVRSEPGFQFENAVACHLLKRNHLLEDLQGERMRLHYLRDKEKREVDFLTVRNNKPEIMLEARLSDDAFAKALFYFSARIRPTKTVQLVKNLKRSKSRGQMSMTSAARWLLELEECVPLAR